MNSPVGEKLIAYSIALGGIRQRESLETYTPIYPCKIVRKKMVY
jgi:hypothetical protein